MKVQTQIEEARRDLAKAKPRSRRRTELELRLRNLRLEQLRYEMLIEPTKAATGIRAAHGLFETLAGWLHMAPAEPLSRNGETVHP